MTDAAFPSIPRFPARINTHEHARGSCSVPMSHHSAVSPRYRFVDTNQIMSQLSGGKPVSDALLAEMGEPVWVQLERQVMDAVQAYMSTVVATGSVAPLDIENWAKFRTGVVVYLSVTEAGLKQGEGIQCGLNGETNALSPGLPEKAGVLPLILAQREARYSQVGPRCIHRLCAAVSESVGGGRERESKGGRGREGGRERGCKRNGDEAEGERER